MSTAAVMAVSQSDIPFESEDEIATRLAHYEEQFSNRYTEEDDWYAGTCQRTGRWHQVPVMSPWPPRRGFAKRKRYDDRRGGYHPDWRSGDRSDRGYHSQRKHEGHSFGRSRSPRRGYYGGGYQQSRSPHHSPRSSSWGEQGHHGHSPLSPSSHDHTHHPPPPPAPVSHTDHTLYPDDEPPPYHSHREKQSLRSRSRSPGSYPWQTGSSQSTGNEDQQLSHGVSGHENEKQIHVEQLHVVGGVDDTTALSQPADEDASVHSQTNAPSARVKAPPPPPLDLGIGEEEEHAVPSKSDVMDILSVASKGANDVTAENLKQVQRETQIQAARKTMKNRQKQQREKSSSGKSNIKTTAIAQPKTHKGRQESVLVTHGHTKNVSQSRLLECGTSLKPISKTHALLQESIAGGAKELSTAPIISTVQRTKTATILASEGIGGDPTPSLRHGEPVTTKSKKGSKSGKKDVVPKSKQKRHKVTRPELWSSSENEELDVVTPDSGNEGSLGVSLNHAFKSESSHVQLSAPKQRQVDRQIRGNVRLSSEDLASDNSDEAMDATQSLEPLSLYVNINRNLISYMPKSAPLSAEDKPLSPIANIAHDQLETDDSEDNSDTFHDSPRYALEYSPNVSTRMVIRTNPPQQFPPSESEGSIVIGDSVVGGVERDTASLITKAAKKKKKKHKHKKVKMGTGDLKMKISLN